MTDEEFERQYKAASHWTAALMDDLLSAAYFSSLDASGLFNALCERLEEFGDIERGELAVILDEIADRLGRLEDMK